jgi:acetoin utilization protein AcuB
MTSAELITNHITPLENTDTVGEALDLMDDFHVRELPVVKDNKFAGLLCFDDIESLNRETTVEDCTPLYKQVFVNAQDFFLIPLRKMHQQQLTLLPVLEEEAQLKGVITEEEILQAASHYNAAAEPGGIIILQVLPNDFSISEIGRIVESNNARIIHLNTWADAATGQLMVSVKVNKNDIQDILASFERYQYNVLQYFGENLSEEELKLNYDHLMNYLNI